MESNLSHRRHRTLESKLDRIEQAVLDLPLAIETLISQLKEEIMTDQEHLDADVAALQTFLTDVEAEVAALKVANPAVDFTALDALVATAKTDDPGAPPAPAPAPAPAG